MINDEILNGMARALYVTAWTDWAERAGISPADVPLRVEV